MGHLDDYREKIQHDISEIKGDMKVLIEINTRQDLHLEKLNGKVGEHEEFKIKTKTWGSMALIIFPLVISLLVKVFL